MDDLIQLTTSLSLEGGVTFPLPPADETPPAEAPPPPPSAFAPEDDSDAPLPLAQVVLGAEDVIPGVTRIPAAAPPAPAPAHEAPASASAGGGGGGAPSAQDLERVRRVLQGLHAPPTDLPPASVEDASDLAAVAALLSSGTVLSPAAPE